MGPYRLASRDVGAFRRVAQDVSEALTHQDVSIAYELSVLGTLIRHASILGCFLLGSPCFSRYEPVERVTNAWGLSSEISEGFPLLYQYRLFLEGRVSSIPIEDGASAQDWLASTLTLLTALEEERVRG